MKNSDVVLLLLVVAIIFCWWLGMRKEPYLSGVSLGFDPSTKIGGSGIGPIEDDRHCVRC